MLKDIFGNMGGMFQGMGGMGGMFQGMGGNNGRARKKEIEFPNLIHKLHLGLAAIYNGVTHEFEITRFNLKKGKQPAKEDMQCTPCKGRGNVTRVMQIGPGMMTQSTQECQDCSGRGTQFPEEFFVAEKRKFSKPIPKGIMDGKKIIVDNQGHQVPKCFADQFPGQERTDLELVISEEEYCEMGESRYIRGVNRSPFNIKLDMNVEPYELICGTVKNIKFLNGKIVSIKIPPGVIFEKGDSAIVIPKMGMPFYKQKGVYGDLFVILNVIGTQTITDEQSSKIWEILKGSTMKSFTESVLSKTDNKYIDALTLSQFQESDAFSKSNQNNRMFQRSASDDENDDGNDTGEGEHNGMPGGCAQQ
jgi:DnaJ-class molecular chaperone